MMEKIKKAYKFIIGIFAGIISILGLIFIGRKLVSEKNEESE